MVFNFCSYLDENYAVRVIVLINSLRNLGINFRFWILCLTQQCKDIIDFFDYPEICSILLEELEHTYPELLDAKNNRSISEYYFTLTPFLPKYILNINHTISSITYLDADLEFFASPELLFDESNDSSIGIIEHRFHPAFDQSNSCGRFNVSWVYFRRDPIALKCLNKWCAQCIDWCSDTPSQGRFADQKYLDSWPKEFENVHIYTHPGANLAPWNLNNHNIQISDDILLSNDKNLIFYHFHMIRMMDHEYIYSALDIYKVPIDLRKIIIDFLYIPYIQKLVVIELFLKKNGFNVNALKSARTNDHIDMLQNKTMSIIQRLEEGEIFRIN